MLKKIGNCHCEKVCFEVILQNGFQNITRCNCSLCKRKGIVCATVNLDCFSILKGKNVIECYQFNTKVAKHYFCKHCGVYTHHQKRSNPLHYGVNIGCFDDIDIGSIHDIKTFNGANPSW